MLIPADSPHWYKTKVKNDDFEAFLIKSAQDMIAMHPPSANPAGLPIEALREEDGPFKIFNADICSRYLSNEPPILSRLLDAYCSMAAHADVNEGRWTVWFTVQKTTKAMKVKGNVFVNGIRVYAELHIDAGVLVFKREKKPPSGVYYALDGVAALFTVQFPNRRHVPVLDRVSSEGSRALLTTTGAGYSNWGRLSAIGEKKKPCFLPLIGLFQFPFVPCDPQHQDVKFGNWGYNQQGVFRTLTYHQQHDPQERIEISSDSDSDSE